MASNTHAHGKIFRDVRGIASSPFARKAERQTKPFQQFFTKFNNDWSMTFAGALAYSLLTAMLPIVIAIFSVLGFILGNGNSTAMLQQAAQPLQSSIHINPTDPAIQRSLHQLSNGAGLLAVVSVVLAIFGGSRLFIAMESFLDIVYRVRPRTMLRQNLIAIAMMVLFIILVPLMVFASTIPGTILGFLQSTPSLKIIPFFSFLANNAVTVTLVSFVAGFIPAFILFEAIYFVVPNQHISWRNSWRGALVAAIALVLFLLVIFPFYSAHFMGNYVGQIGFAVVLLVFFYYFAVILMLGAEVNAFFFEHVLPLPNDLATFVSTMAGKLNHDLSSVEAQPHVNSKPTDRADKAHVIESSRQEAQTQERGSHATVTPENSTIPNTPNTPGSNTDTTDASSASSTSSKPARRKKKTSQRKPSRLLTLVEVVMGSLMAMVIELFRHRQMGK